MNFEDVDTLIMYKIFEYLHYYANTKYQPIFVMICKRFSDIYKSFLFNSKSLCINNINPFLSANLLNVEELRLENIKINNLIMEKFPNIKSIVLLSTKVNDEIILTNKIKKITIEKCILSVGNLHGHFNLEELTIKNTICNKNTIGRLFSHSLKKLSFNTCNSYWLDELANLSNLEELDINFDYRIFYYDELGHFSNLDVLNNVEKICVDFSFCGNIFGYIFGLLKNKKLKQLTIKNMKLNMQMLKLFSAAKNVKIIMIDCGYEKIKECCTIIKKSSNLQKIISSTHKVIMH
jgi:hypothetical protein